MRVQSLELDPRFTFESFVVGPSNRLGAAAARRVAESPGTTYNPLFIYSGSGLGKTHLLTAIGHQVARLQPQVEVVYETLEHLLDQVRSAVEAGEPDAARNRLAETGLLLLDDVQFLAGHREMQEELLRAWDGLAGRGAQVVLSSDRPPQEIDGIDERLLSRLSGGLIVDMSAPDFETRIAIVHRKVSERGQQLADGVAEALARIAFSNVRELQGALNRIVAVQELEQRTVAAGEIAKLLGAGQRNKDEFGEFLSEITGTVGEVVAEAERRLADAILCWEGEGYRTRRLEAALTANTPPGRVDEIIRRFEADVGRLRDIRAELEALGVDAEESRRAEVLYDPDRLAEAEALLGSVRERERPLPEPESGPGLDELDDLVDPLTLRAARAVVEQPASRYNPLFVYGADAAGRSTLLRALGRALGEDGRRVGMVEAAAFSGELVDALAESSLESWRARYRGAQALVVDRLEALSGTERAQEELFHLFDELLRSGAQLVFGAEAPPRALGLEDRLCSRLEGGLVVELAPDAPREPVGEEPSAAAAPADAHAAGAAAQLDEQAVEAWGLTRENIPWEWPYAEDWLIEALD